MPAGAGQPSLCILGAASWIKSATGAAAFVESGPFGAVLAAFTLRGVQEIELWPVVVNISIYGTIVDDALYVPRVELSYTPEEPEFLSL